VATRGYSELGNPTGECLGGVTALLVPAGSRAAAWLAAPPPTSYAAAPQTEPPPGAELLGRAAPALPRCSLFARCAASRVARFPGPTRFCVTVPMPNSALPLWLKVSYTVWMATWGVLYWLENGPQNFLWFCDLANWITLAGLWAESPLLLSASLVGVALGQIGWALDFFGRMALGFHPIGGTEYMFDPATPLWLRALSLFHLWMLPLLIWLVRRTGYDRRGFVLQSALAVVGCRSRSGWAPARTTSTGCGDRSEWSRPGCRPGCGYSAPWCSIRWCCSIRHIWRPGPACPRRRRRWSPRNRTSRVKQAATPAPDSST
jgi:hypothetical protein